MKKDSTKPSKEAKKTPKTKEIKIDKWLRQRRRKLDKLTNNALKHSKRFLVERLDHIRNVRRSVVVWLFVVLMLIIGSFTQTIAYEGQIEVLAPANGGAYAEGVVDKLTTINPLYASTDTEKAASQLVYPGLLSYDTANKLHGELAESWSMDETGKIWTVKLKPNIKWSDKKPLTADDVTFTISLMQNNDINDVLGDAWDSISATVKDQHTVEFKLPLPLTSFDSTLTFGILPKHILDGKTPLEIAELTSRKPREIIGSGEFNIDRVETTATTSTWYFKPNKQYYADHTKLDEFIIRTYPDSSSMLAGLKRGEVNAISGVKIDDITNTDTNRFKVAQLKTSGGIYAIFNTDAPVVSDLTIRNALRLSMDRNSIRNKITGNNSLLSAPATLDGPIATGVYDSVDKLKQPTVNIDEAKKLLDSVGWKQTDGQKYRTKDGQELTINVVTIAGTNYESVAEQITSQWQSIGVNAKVQVISPNIAQQNYLIPRNYDVLVYQMHLGADPDVYSYWSSTQATASGLNLANYRSQRAEISLANARLNTNATAREARYTAFVKQWLKDNPAIAIYQPSLFYIMDRNINTVATGESVIDASNRFANISNWTVRSSLIMATP